MYIAVKPEEDVFQIIRCLGKRVVPEDEVQGLVQMEADGPLCCSTPATFSQLGITKAHSDRGFFAMKLRDDSRNLTDKQMFFPSGAFLNEMVA